MMPLVSLAGNKYLIIRSLEYNGMREKGGEIKEKKEKVGKKMVKENEVT